MCVLPKKDNRTTAATKCKSNTQSLSGVPINPFTHSKSPELILDWYITHALDMHLILLFPILFLSYSLLFSFSIFSMSYE